MQEFSTMTVRDIAIAAPLTTRVFEEFKIDFCCGGRVPFEQACEMAGVDPAIVQAKLETVLRNVDGVDYSERKRPSELIEFIVDKHHEFTRDEIARLLPLMDKVVSRHGDGHTELHEIRKIFRELADEMLVHMRKEEMVLFPYIEKLEAASAGQGAVPIAHFGTVNNPVRMMMFEHESAGEMLKNMRRLSGGYTAPDGACPSYISLYAGLEDLEKDLHRHIHLENNILFPEAIEMEKTFFAQV